MLATTLLLHYVCFSFVVLEVLAISYKPHVISSTHHPHQSNTLRGFRDHKLVFGNSGMVRDRDILPENATQSEGNSQLVCTSLSSTNDDSLIITVISTGWSGSVSWLSVQVYGTQSMRIEWLQVCTYLPLNIRTPHLLQTENIHITMDHLQTNQSRSYIALFLNCV